VRDARERPREGVCVEKGFPRRFHCTHSAGSVDGTGTCMVIRLLSGLTGPG
jgi:hypothetical protein